MLFSFVEDYWWFYTIAFSHILPKFEAFFLPGIANLHSLIASVQHELVTLASVSPAPPASSPSLEVNGGIDLLMHQIVRHRDCLKYIGCGRGSRKSSR